MKKLVWFLAAFLMVNALVCADSTKATRFGIHYLMDKTVFSGDKHGDFARDYVAFLSDGSQWKVHPEDSRSFYKWNINDPIYLQIRTTHYWFKREHKFEMFNAANNQSVRVMLVSYPDIPLRILASEVYYVDTTIYITQYTDQYGNVYYTYYYEDIYEKAIVLNDGSRWVITNKDKFPHFLSGDYVYLILQAGNYYLISGNEREAVYTQLFIR